MISFLCSLRLWLLKPLRKLDTPLQNSFKLSPTTRSTNNSPRITPHRHHQLKITVWSISFQFHLDSFLRRDWRGRRVGGRGYWWGTSSVGLHSVRVKRRVSLDESHSGSLREIKYWGVRRVCRGETDRRLYNSSNLGTRIELFPLIRFFRLDNFSIQLQTFTRFEQ